MPRLSRRLVVVMVATGATVLTLAPGAWADGNSGNFASAGDTYNPAGAFAGASFSVNAPGTGSGSGPAASGGGHYSGGVGHGSGGAGGPTGPPPYVFLPSTLIGGPNGQQGVYAVVNPLNSAASNAAAANTAACGGTPFCFFPTGPPAPPGKGPAAPPPSPAQLALMAASDMTLPTPTIQTWPPMAKGAVVNLSTWVHVTNWGASTTSASAGPVTSTVTARPTTMVLSAPDSTDAGEDYNSPISASCAGPGPIYNPSISDSAQSSPCELTWAWPSANFNSFGTYPMVVSVSYQVSWAASGAPGGGALPSITATATIPIHVGEIEAIGVP